MMNYGEIIARHYATREPVKVRWEGSSIISIEPSDPPVDDLWIAPGIVDVQVNGYGGTDFQKDDFTLAELETSVTKLREAGCSRILFTLTTAEWPKMTGRLRLARRLREQSKLLRSAIAGWHIEGPFMSSEPGFHGAHNPALMLNPTAAHIHELRDITGNDPLLLTVSPERHGSIEAIALAVSLGIKISLGHTDASQETLRRAVEAGATGFTHLGNGCTRELNRADNIIWRVLDTPELIVGVIYDGMHVSSGLFRLMHKVIDPNRLYYTTDAMSAAGAPPGRYTLGPMEIEVGEDQVVRQPGRTNFAGSALRPIDGVFRAAKMLNRDWQDVWDSATRVPTRLMDLPFHGLEKGQPNDFCLLKFEGQKFCNLQIVG